MVQESAKEGNAVMASNYNPECDEEGNFKSEVMASDDMYFLYTVANKLLGFPEFFAILSPMKGEKPLYHSDVRDRISDVQEIFRLLAERVEKKTARIGDILKVGNSRSYILAVKEPTGPSKYKIVMEMTTKYYGSFDYEVLALVPMFNDKLAEHKTPGRLQ